MATTMSPALANSIAEFKKYVDDPSNTYAVFRAASLTTELETPMGEFGDNTTFSYPVFPFDSSDIPDYSKANGFTAESVTYERRDVVFSQDKGYSIPVDYRDMKENHMTAVAIYNNKLRQRDVPAIDKYRLAALVAGTNASDKATNSKHQILSAVVGALTSSTICAKLDTAKSAIFDAEIPVEGLILYVPTDNYDALKGAITRRVENGDANVDNTVEYYNGMKVKEIPTGRFPSGVEFIVVQPACLICGVKFEVVDFFERSERFSGALVNKRFVHDCIIQIDRANGVYVGKTSA